MDQWTDVLYLLADCLVQLDRSNYQCIVAIVTSAICVSYSVFFVRIIQNYSTNIHKIWWKGGTRAVEDTVRFYVRDGIVVGCWFVGGDDLTVELCTTYSSSWHHHFRHP